MQIPYYSVLCTALLCNVLPQAAMQAHALGSKVVLALLSLGIFDSEWCRAEIEAAAAAGVPIVPVYSGEHYAANQVLELNKKYQSDPVKGAAVKAREAPCPYFAYKALHNMDNLHVKH